jgi:hypothetical protein
MRIRSVPTIEPLPGVSRFAIVAAVDGMEWEATALDMSRPTSDGRMIVQDGVSIRKPPLALLYTPSLDDGHNGAIQVGTIQQASIDGSLVQMAGTWIDSPDPDTQATIDDVKARTGNEDGLSVSVDLAVQKAVLTLVIPGEEEQQVEQAIEQGEDIEVEIPLVDTENEVLRIDQCEIIGLTIVPQPAQDGLSFTNLVWDDTAAEPVAASADPDTEPDVPAATHDMSGVVQTLRLALMTGKGAELARLVDAKILTEDEVRGMFGLAPHNGHRMEADLVDIAALLSRGQDATDKIVETLARIEKKPGALTLNLPPAGGAKTVNVIRDDDGNVTGYETVAE